MPDKFKHQASTDFSYAKCIFNDVIDIKAEKDVVFDITIESIMNGKVNFSMVTTREDEKGQVKSYMMQPGDTFSLKHIFTINSVERVDDKHPFPIKIEFKGQTYFLKKTKADKLILTK
ncbi:MAG: hemin uptake protein HemP [Proteobacteria bacterium]|nr:hemin uptake protein HemP [Pseudomonadota bacterium]MBU4470304.1 hemin uptake protein HemP [Pseudomonadota bacterium]MCG2752716.1 hemin uptake protein HemP [Desulfobacteraceae bacterium]